MIQKIMCLIVLISVIAFADGITVLKQEKSPVKKKNEKTVIEFVLDSSSKDVDIPISLFNYRTHGTVSTGYGSITYYSNNKIADVPSTISLPQGPYYLNLSNNTRTGRTGMKVDANGGYQKWKVTPGDHRKAKKYRKKASLYLSVGACIGGTLVAIGHAKRAKCRYDIENADDKIVRKTKSVESRKERVAYYEGQVEYYKNKYNSTGYDFYYDSWKDAEADVKEAEADVKEARAGVKEAQTEKKNAEESIDKTLGFLIPGYSIMGIGFTFNIPNIKKAKKHRMRAELLEKKAVAPMAAVESEGVMQ